MISSLYIHVYLQGQRSKYVLMSLFLSAFCFTSLSGQCTHPDFEALMTLFNQTDGKNWIDNTGWIEGEEGSSCDPCEDDWKGVVCEDGRVRSIFLTQNGLKGTLPELNLPKLQVLYMERNDLKGELPDFSNTPKLTGVNLDDNKLTGMIPEWSLPNLIFFRCHTNNLTGPIPNFENCNQLEMLNLSQNNFNDTIPNFIHTPLLKNLDINNSNLNGELPSFSENVELEYLNLYNNNLEGKFPDLSHMQRLRQINVSNNNITGCIPDFFLTNNFNSSFTGNVGMAFYGDLDAFHDANRQNLGAPCEPVGYLGATAILDDNCDCVLKECSPPQPHPEVEALRIIYESTGGENWINNTGWQALFDGLRCSPCDSEYGNIYGVSCRLGRVWCLDFDGSVSCDFNGIGGNNLVGEWPSVKLEYLERLILDGNELIGSFPDLEKLPRLLELQATHNQFSGELPDLTTASQLEVIRISNNLFTGPFPKIDTSSELKILTVANNNLSGCYEDWLCDLELFHAAGNNLLPWYGDGNNFCLGQQQHNAPCGDPTGNYAIQDNCECDGTILSKIDEQSTALPFYPNPAQSLLHLTDIKNISHYNIYNSSGDLIRNNLAIESQISIPDLVQGIYLLQLVNKQGVKSVYKFVKN